MSLDNQSKKELKWWLESLLSGNEKTINILPPDLITSSEAAKGKNGGWGGAHCSQISSGGLWQNWERKEHVNVLEMQEALVALSQYNY